MTPLPDHSLAVKILPKRAGEKEEVYNGRLVDAIHAISAAMLPERQALADLVSRLEQVQEEPSFKAVFEAAKAQGVFFRGKPWKEELERAQAIVETYPSPEIST